MLSLINLLIICGENTPYQMKKAMIQGEHEKRDLRIERTMNMGGGKDRGGRYSEASTGIIT